MEEELNAHLELQVRKYTRAGIGADQARVLARCDSGALENAMDQCRDERRVTWAANLGRDFKYAARAFRRDPGFSALATFVLALGIGANVAVFSVMDAMLLRMLPVEEPGRLFRSVRANGSATIHREGPVPTRPISRCASRSARLPISWHTNRRSRKLSA